jgi:hypothetical protein
MRIRSGIQDLYDPGSGMEKFESGIRDKHPGSATLPASILNSDSKTTGAGIRIQI